MSDGECSECHRARARDEEVDDLYARLERLTAENDRLKSREEHFARALGVADGGQYRADWDAAISRVVNELAALRAAVAPTGENVANLRAAISRAEAKTGLVFTINDSLRAALTSINERAGTKP